jgi:hypothetical protein
MRKPWEPPEKRPSVSNATSWPSPAPINADEGFNISRLARLCLRVPGIPGPPRGPS